MNEEIKKDWIEALESGEYKQGTGVLQSPTDQYCCLGVLCDLAVKAGVASKHPSSYGNFTFGPAGERPEDITDLSAADQFNRWQRCSLPDVVMKWAGLDDSDPSVYRSYAGGRSLAGLNDERTENANGELGAGAIKNSFVDIARLIRKHL